MKNRLIIAGIVALGVASCASMMPYVNSAYSAVCVGSPSQPSALASIQAVSAIQPLTAAQQNVFTQVQTDCAQGAPTNVLTATVDFVGLYNSVRANFPKLKLPAL